MSEISRAALFGKLNSLGYKAIEAATVFCKLRGNPHVEMIAEWCLGAALHHLGEQTNRKPQQAHISHCVTRYRELGHA